MLKSQIKQLECQLDEKDKEYEKKLRTMRQEIERVKEQYENKKGFNNADSKRIAELEAEIDQTKQYYNKRIREIEEKNKYRNPTPSTTITDKKLTTKTAPLSKQPQ